MNTLVVFNFFCAEHWALFVDTEAKVRETSAAISHSSGCHYLLCQVAGLDYLGNRASGAAYNARTRMRGGLGTM